MIGVDNNVKTASDAESDVDFKHRRRVRQNSDDLSMDDLGTDRFFLDVPESSVVPSNLEIVSTSYLLTVRFFLNISV